MKSIIKNNDGSIYGIGVLIGVLGLASFLSLLFGHILEPFFSFMRTGMVRDFLLLMFPKGLLLVILIAMAGCTLMYYQKKSYNTGGAF